MKDSSLPEKCHTILILGQTMGQQALAMEESLTRFPVGSLEYTLQLELMNIWHEGYYGPETPQPPE